MRSDVTSRAVCARSRIGRCNPVLQAGGDDEGQQPAPGENREHDQPEQPHAPREFVEARPDVDRPEQFAVEDDGPGDDQRTVRERGRRRAIGVDGAVSRAWSAAL